MADKNFKCINCGRFIEVENSLCAFCFNDKSLYQALKENDKKKVKEIESRAEKGEVVRLI